MEATFSLSSRLQAYPARLFTSIDLQPTIISRPHNNITSFHHQPSHSAHLRVMCGHKSRHVAHVLKALRMDGDDGKSKTGAMVGASVVLACVLGSMCLTRPGLALGWPWPSKTILSPLAEPANIRPDSNLKALYVTKRPVDPDTLRKANDEFKSQLKEERIEYYNLEKAAWILELSAEIDTAVEALRKKYDATQIKDYSLGILLVEMLIYQGELEKAEQLLTELKDMTGEMSDGRPELYAAVISVMKKKDVEDHWNEYIVKDKHDDGPPSVTDIKDKNQAQEDPTKRFIEFKNQMEVLKTTIKENRKNRQDIKK